MNLIDKYPELLITLILNMDSKPQAPEILLRRVRQGVHSNNFLSVSELRQLLTRAMSLGIVKEADSGFYISESWWAILQSIASGSTDPDIYSLGQADFFERLSKIGITLENAIELERTFAKGEDKLGHE